MNEQELTNLMTSEQKVACLLGIARNGLMMAVDVIDGDQPYKDMIDHELLQGIRGMVVFLTVSPPPPPAPPELEV